MKQDCRQEEKEGLCPGQGEHGPRLTKAGEKGEGERADWAACRHKTKGLQLSSAPQELEFFLA